MSAFRILSMRFGSLISLRPHGHLGAVDLILREALRSPVLSPSVSRSDDLELAEHSQNVKLVSLCAA
jgi:hypothetical protein